MENIHHLITTTRPWYTRIISVSISISQENPNKVFTLPAETGPSHKTVSRNTKHPIQNQHLYLKYFSTPCSPVGSPNVSKGSTTSNSRVAEGVPTKTTIHTFTVARTSYLIKIAEYTCRKYVNAVPNWTTPLNFYCVCFEVPTEASMKMAVVWVVAPYSLVEAESWFIVVAIIMEIGSTPEISIQFYQTTRRNKPEGRHLLPSMFVFAPNNTDTPVPPVLTLVRH
jgi:hypothetical protein